MSVSLEKLDGSMAKLTVEVAPEELDAAIKKVYNSMKKRIQIPGFRKGKVPQQIVEKYYGKEVFYEDAANDLIRQNYPKAVEECEEEITSRPKIEVKQLEAGKPFIYTAEVALKPPVSLGKYKGIEADPMVVEVEEEEVNKAIDTDRRNASRIVDTERDTVQMGDMIELDFEGFIDDTPFKGGKGENYRLEIGSGQFIPGFEDQLVGAKLEEEKDVNVTFPEEYQAPELAGKPAVFKCVVHKIQERQMPELDDEFVSDISEYDTVDEYKKSVRERLEKEKKDAERAKREDQVLKAVIEDADMELPEPMIESQQLQILEDFATRLSYQGMGLEQYLQMTGSTEEKMMEQVRPQALDRIKSRLVLEAVADAEGLTASDEEVEKEIEDRAKQSFIAVDKYKERLTAYDQKILRRDIAVRKAADFLVDNAKDGKAKKSRGKKKADAEE